MSNHYTTTQAFFVFETKRYCIFEVIRLPTCPGNSITSISGVSSHIAQAILHSSKFNVNDALQTKNFGYQFCVQGELNSMFRCARVFLGEIFPSESPGTAKPGRSQGGCFPAFWVSREYNWAVVGRSEVVLDRGPIEKTQSHFGRNLLGP